MEARIALELLAKKAPTLALKDDQDLSVFPNITFRGPEKLHLTW